MHWPPVHRWSPTRIAAITSIAGIAWAATLLLRTTGTATDDEIGHFLIARDAWQMPELILNQWGRVANTIVFLLPAAAGLPAARLWALALSAITALLALRVAKQLDTPYYWLAPLLCWAQPWFGNLSFSAITEVPFSLFSVAAVSLFLDRRFAFAGLLVGLLALTRHEGILLVALWLCYCLWARRWPGAVTALAPLIVYNGFAFVTTESWPLTMYLAATRDAFYGAGGWLHYVPRLVSGVGVPITAIALLGLPPMLARGSQRLVVVWYAAYLLLHVVFLRYGLFATGGYRLMLFPLAPAFAIAACRGLPIAARLARSLLSKVNTRASSLATAATVAIVLAVGLSATPFEADKEKVALTRAAEWLIAEDLTQRRIVATHVWFYYHLPLRIDPLQLWSGLPDLKWLPAGSLAVWDSQYSDRWGLRRELLVKDGWVVRTDFGAAAVLEKR